MMSKKSPQLRFEGFTDDWEERKLGEISRMYQPLTITGNDLLPDGVPVFGANGFIGFFSEANHIEDQVTISARGEGTGTPSYVHGPVWITGNSMVVNVDDFDINKYFLFANLTANSLKKYVTGGAQPQLTRDVLVKVPITLPNADEQQKIASFFQQLDNTITLHQHKLDLLKEQKKGFLQKMFPKNGDKVPELRFAGFADDWEERKLGEYVNFLNGRAYKQSELLDKGKYKVVRVGNFNTNDRWYYSDLELDQNKYAQKGDLLYLWATNFGPEIWSEEKVIYHYHIWKLELLNNNLDKQYLYTWLVTDKERIKQNTNGTTMVHVTKGNMEQRDFQFPGLNEQQKIGSFFKQLDDTIALHQRKLDLLKEQKKGFLQKMFV